MIRKLPGVFLLSLIFISLSTLAHRQHFASTNILWNAKTSIMEIEHRVHEHDAAKMLSRLSRGQTDLTKPEAQAKFALYVANHFKIYNGESKLTPSLLGAEIIGHHIYVYQELQLTELPVHFAFETSILMDLFDDQIHIISLRVAENVRTIEFDKYSSRQRVFPHATSHRDP